MYELSYCSHKASFLSLLHKATQELFWEVLQVLFGAVDPEVHVHGVLIIRKM